jgi:bifunctional non-homologous end joining protein LigD
MKALPSAHIPTGEGWSFELKLDGVRAIGVRDGNKVQLFSRRPRDITTEYPALVEALRTLPAQRWVMDGEIVALDDEGRSSFQLLQNRNRFESSNTPVVLYLFDLLNLEGRNLTDLPLLKRKEILRELIHGAPKLLRFSETLDAPAKKIWTRILELKLEGIIAKRSDSIYESGRRSGAWLKVKALQQQEFVIGGYTPPEGSRKFFGALIIGYYAGKELKYASKVGTGFDFATLKRLYQLFQKYRIPTCPFADLPTKRIGRFGQGLTASMMKTCIWLKPRFVCQVKFQEWTQDDNLRQPVFLGLREDKLAKEVVREKCNG